MRRGEIFWGALLIILGVLFYLKTAGYLSGDIFSWFWPFFIIAGGIWILQGGYGYRKSFENHQKFSVPIQGAQEASLSIDHGMGRIVVQAGADPGDFLTGNAGRGIKNKFSLNGNKLEVKIEPDPSFPLFIRPEGGVLQLHLNADLSTMIKIQAGASRLDLDLSDLHVTSFSFEGGASSLNLTLPARTDLTHVDLEAGAASINLTVPDGVAMRFQTKSFGSLDIDPVRFPRRDDGLYESPDFDSANYRAEVTIKGGATSVKVH